VSNTAGTPSHQPSRLVHGHHALRRVGARARNAAAAPPSKASDPDWHAPLSARGRLIWGTIPRSEYAVFGFASGMPLPSASPTMLAMGQKREWRRLNGTSALPPRERTSLDAVGMSQTCQFRKSRLMAAFPTIAEAGIWW